MRPRTEYPWATRELEHVTIPMSDGARLAARIWLPEGAESAPVPAVLEYIPYRKRDLRTPTDAMNQPYIAGHGYASVRVDLRGSGDSEGVLTDEYLPVELDDGAQVLRWLAAQPWCDGNIGMIGISWGGFNGLQIAALAPPELKAVITVCSTDDRYADDVHYMGGCLLLDNLSWAAIMFAYNSCPPDPALVGDRWRNMWFERLAGSGLWLDTWLQHQRRDSYWKHGSICEDYGAVRCPVYAVGGWADGYSNAVPRMLAGLEVPRKGLIGPWSHRYPHLGEPGPAIGFLQESLRWWDYWLKGEDTGIMQEPMLRVWMQDAAAPAARYAHRPGRWVAEDYWPPPHIEQRSWYPRPDGLAEQPGDGDEPMSVHSPLRTGMAAGKWCSYLDGPDLPIDQREDDEGSLVFDGPPLREALEILGAPVAELEVSADRPAAMAAVRLSVVAPDGAATRVTYGLLNLAHREGHEQPHSLQPGERYRVRIRLNDIAQHFPAGHRLRLSVSSSYWPVAWPPPEPVTLSLYPRRSRLLLPVRAPRESDRQLRPFGEPEAAPRPARTVLERPRNTWRTAHDRATDTRTLEVIEDKGVYRLEAAGTTVEHRGREHYSIIGDNVLSARGETRWLIGFRRPGWTVSTVTRTVLTCSAGELQVRADLQAYEEDTEVYRTSWQRTIPRDHL